MFHTIWWVFTPPSGDNKVPKRIIHIWKPVFNWWKPRNNLNLLDAKLCVLDYLIHCLIFNLHQKKIWDVKILRFKELKLLLSDVGLRMWALGSNLTSKPRLLNTYMTPFKSHFGPFYNWYFLPMLGSNLHNLLVYSTHSLTLQFYYLSKVHNKEAEHWPSSPWG